MEDWLLERILSYNKDNLYGDTERLRLINLACKISEERARRDFEKLQRGGYRIEETEEELGFIDEHPLGRG